MTKSEAITTEDTDRMVDEGQDMTAYIKMDTLQTPNLKEALHKVAIVFKLLKASE